MAEAADPFAEFAARYSEGPRRNRFVAGGLNMSTSHHLCRGRWIATVCLSVVCAAPWLPASESGPARTDSVPASRIRQLTSAHLKLATDLAPSEQVDALPRWFDQAFVQWCEYFGVDATKH